ncbi:PREDICTED: translation initiation factor eIF-2B subunit epsilon-like [Branchiostoma belcheri]|uniref:Translation initiation factor eIF2B subunit epsilon n=1 Tax=Branchiostoma belcheri TaxID=7741 RepID=A0A6P4YBN1_BRABE|nr:PREDICTED: translation initiation factor eIF-2B subunit epsilon-like [Branchiostoma belcheri]
MASRGRKRADVVEQEDVLQAVIIADSFDVRFAPITKDVPRALMPVANRPLLEYTLHFLVAAGIQEICVFCCSHANKIVQYLSDAGWTSDAAPCQVTTQVSEDSLSPGDALRLIYDRSLIRTDFVLVMGDLVSTINLQPIIQQHKQRRLKDKVTVMTMVFREAAPRHHTRSSDDDVVLVTEKDTDRVLHYQMVEGQSKLDLPLDLFSDHSDLDIRYNLLDCHVSVCSPQVPQLFADNFDYQTRNDFVRGILVHEEIMGNQVHAHVVTDEYAARVSSPHMYDAVSKDILQRWTYPLVPDNRLSSQEQDSSYTLHRHHVYRGRDVFLDHDSVLEENVVIGPGTRIGSNTTISNSVIGRNCVIGDHVRLEGVYLWDNVSIGSACSLTQCIVCSGVTIANGVVVEPSCVLSFDVVVGPDVQLPAGTRVSLHPNQTQAAEDDFQEPTETIQHHTYQPDRIGTDGKGYIWEQDEDEDSLVTSMWGLRLDQEESSSEESEESAEEEDDMDQETSPPLDDMRIFYTEVLDSMQRAIEENINADNLILEINSSKYAYNISMQELNVCVVRCVLEVAHLRATLMATAAEYLAALKPLLQPMKGLLKNYIRNSDSQQDCLLAVEEYFGTHLNISAVLVTLLNFLYNEDILEEDSILKWYRHPAPSSSLPQKAQQQVRAAAAKFIQWLQEAEEESEEDSD